MSIYYANPPVGPNYVGTLTDVNIIDYLPDEINYYSSDPCGVYDADTRTVTWNIETLPPGESNSVKLTVTVNNLAEPLGTITNKAVMTSNIGRVAATEIMDVNSWKPPVIYVDDNAPGSDTGMSWHNAYRDLQDALTRARAGCGSQIWVAAGTYKPTQNIYDTDANFALVNGVPIYGGFPSGGGERSWMTSETILDGQNIVTKVVTAANIEDIIVDGFTIRGSYDGSGIYLVDANIAIVNCKFTDNSPDGICCLESGLVITNSTFDGNNATSSAIYAANLSDVKLADCTVKKHTGDGISVNNSNIEINHSMIERNSYAGLHCSSGSTLTLTNSVIRFNDNYGGNHGIYLDDILSATIKNNLIHNNGTNSSGDGIYIYNYEVTPLTPAVIRNNTIFHNAGYGISRYHWLTPDPNISNCIIWDNNTPQLYSDCGDFENVRYSCIQDGTTDNNNINADPCFLSPNDPNDYHIGPNSPCIDRGDPNGNYSGETDIDGENRTIDGDSNSTAIVDIGADEYYWIVNFFDYAEFANAWMSDPNDPNWNPKCDIGIPADNHIDYADLAVFCEDWLSQAGWARALTCGIGHGVGQIMGQGMSQTMTPALAPPVRTAGKTPYKSISAERQVEKIEPLEVEQVDIEVILKWLDEIWLDPEVRKAITEDEWLKFIESVASELK